MKPSITGEILGIIILGSCICFAWACDLYTGSNYLEGIRETEGYK